MNCETIAGGEVGEASHSPKDESTRSAHEAVDPPVGPVEEDGADGHHSPRRGRSPPAPLNRYQERYAWFVSDVLLYIIILNLSSEFVRNIHIERFSISLFVAVVLKLVLSGIQALEHSIKHLFCEVWNRKVVGGFFMWLVIFSSKFLILWIDDVIFGSQVELGYFWEILILSLVLVLSSIASRWLFAQLGRWGENHVSFIQRNQDLTSREQSNDVENGDH